jgi:hypothetical protein
MNQEKGPDSRVNEKGARQSTNWNWARNGQPDARRQYRTPEAIWDAFESRTLPLLREMREMGRRRRALEVGGLR